MADSPEKMPTPVNAIAAVDPNSSPDFEPETNSEEHYRCSRILANSMRCPRIANRRQLKDKEGKYAVCNVCWQLEGRPPDYTVIIAENL